MKKTQTAKLFKNGSSQAVRLPSDFRFNSHEVYISRDETTGDVVLSNRPDAGAWKDFFDLIHSIQASTNFKITGWRPRLGNEEESLLYRTLSDTLNRTINSAGKRYESINLRMKTQ